MIRRSVISLRRLFRTSGLTQQGFADLFGVHLSTVRRWLHGHGRPSFLAWCRIDQVLNGEWVAPVTKRDTNQAA